MENDVKCRFCDRVFGSKQARGAHEGLEHDSRVSVQCTYCGDNFDKIHSRASEHENHFCNSECHKKFLAEMRNVSGENSPSYSGGKEVYQCENCDKNVEKWPSQVCGDVVCSDKCFNSIHSEKMSGENHPRWKGGDVKYGKNWESVREAQIERDYFECVKCGITRSEHLEKYDADLSVHHIIPIRNFDEPENGNFEENLKTLCKSCHRTVENEDYKEY
jgi:5-methylcytosine-specific restriction endonuclease McrA